MGDAVVSVVDEPAAENHGVLLVADFGTFVPSANGTAGMTVVIDRPEKELEPRGWAASCFVARAT